ncbi:MAG: hypothetical protein IKR52_06270 [Paludibacteraceae bacterium]|nr:hypothetical protein [Paludibacteraceae bacterium]
MDYTTEKRIVEGMEVTVYKRNGHDYYELDDAMEILLRRLKKDEKENEGKKRRIAGTEESEADNSDI